MKVVLLESVSKLGGKGEVVQVSNGYARNFLFPKKLAVVAGTGEQKIADELKRIAARRQTKESEEAKLIAEKLGSINCIVKAKAGESDKLFGSVTSQDIAEALKKEGLDIDKKQIEIEKPIKELGNYEVPVKLAGEVTGTLKVTVIKEG